MPRPPRRGGLGGGPPAVAAVAARRLEIERHGDSASDSELPRPGSVSPAPARQCHGVAAAGGVHRDNRSHGASVSVTVSDLRPGLPVAVAGTRLELKLARAVRGAAAGVAGPGPGLRVKLIATDTGIWGPAGPGLVPVIWILGRYEFIVLTMNS
jgi:hypothetical protein